MNAPETRTAIGLGLILSVLCAVTLIWIGIQSGSGPQKQSGILLLIACVLCMPLAFVGDARRKKYLRSLLGVVVFVAIFFFWGEFAMRILFSGGESFDSHTGPIVERFEGNFQFNHYDGPSRGPEYLQFADPASVKLLVQGDSITWGQGVRQEAQLYTTQVVSKLRETGIAADMAVLAKPGREIDDHLEQLRKWGKILRPDVIVYQWTINDIELDKSLRPKSNWIWRRTIIHKYLVRRSYLWFFLDWSVDRIFSNSQQYVPYLEANYSEASDGWNAFTSILNQWCNAARSLTPRVLVVMYPQMSLPSGMPPTFTEVGQDIIRRTSEQCAGVVFLDLSKPFEQFHDASQIRATRFDRHPSAAAHSVIADEVIKALQVLWPEKFVVDPGLVEPQASGSRNAASVPVVGRIGAYRASASCPRTSVCLWRRAPERRPGSMLRGRERATAVKSPAIVLAAGRAARGRSGAAGQGLRSASTSRRSRP